MKTYRTNEKVPWREITAVLYWYLELQVQDIRRFQKQGRQEFMELSLPRLRTTKDSIHSLRRFLGYAGDTKWEQEAALLLGGETKERLF